MKTPCDEGLIAAGSSCVAPTRTQGAWILAGTILGSTMVFIDGTIVNVAVPALQTTFHASAVDVQWVIESYGVLLSSLILAGGALGDLFGRRRIFLIGALIFTAASAACGLASSIQGLIAARCVQGIGAALLVPGSLAIISACFDEDSRGKAIGTWSGFTAITTALGPVLGGWLIQYESWRWAFLLNIPLALAVVGISYLHVPESRGSQVKQVDWLGTLLATAGLAAVVTGFLESVRLGWSNLLVSAGLLGGFLVLAMFLTVETRAPSPMVPLGLFRSRSFLGANILTLFLYSTIGIFFFLFPMDLIQLQGYTATAAGSAMLPMILLMFSLSRWSGGLVKRYGGRMPLVIGPLIVAAGFALFAAAHPPFRYWKMYFPASLVFGFGMAVTVAPLTTVVMNSVDQRHAGTASGINNAVARVAGVLAIAIFGIVMMKSFDARLERSLMTLSLAPNIVQEIRSKEVELAALKPPDGVDAPTASAIRAAISESFDSGFRVVLLCCVGLSIGSAVVAWRLVAPPTIVGTASD